jgi:hypothetical protein
MSLVVNASNEVAVYGLRDDDYEIDNDATVTVEIRDSNDQIVPGETFPKTLVSTGSGGNYEVSLAPTLGIVVGEIYKQTILAVNNATSKQTPFVKYLTAVESGGC